MKTEQLVESLVADRARSAASLRRSVAHAVALGSILSLAIFTLEFGPRADLAAAFATWRFDLKLVLVLAALLAAAGACIALARPLASRSWRRGVGALAVLAVSGLAIELILAPAGTWGTRLVGSNVRVCLTAIPVLALGPLVGLLMALRRAAPASPALAGAACGALAAATAAVLYAFHCFDNSPLFVLTWYPLAAVPVILLGAAVGHRLLRW